VGVFGLSQNTCTWLKGGSVGGLQATEFFEIALAGDLHHLHGVSLIPVRDLPVAVRVGDFLPGEPAVLVVLIPH
jgi:hypothetical protein